MQSTLADLRLLMRDLPASLDNVKAQPPVERDTAHYLSKIGTIKSLDAFMSDDRVYRFALQAFGLQDMAYAKAFIRKVLSEGMDQPKALANRLADPRFREFVEAFNFARYGSATTSFSRTQEGTVDRFVRLTLEIDAGKTNEGLRLALYFQRKASGISTPYALLADRALFRVTQVALGMPNGSAGQNIDRQAELITKRLKISDLQNPQAVEKLLTRFAALWDIEQPNPMQSPVVSLMNGQREDGIGVDVLTRIQNTRMGR